MSTDGRENSTALIASGYDQLVGLIEKYIIYETICNPEVITVPPKPSVPETTTPAPEGKSLVSV